MIIIMYEFYINQQIWQSDPAYKNVITRASASLHLAS